MNDKDLSKPIGLANNAALKYAQHSGCGFEAYASDNVQGYDTPVYSAEYVQSLLGRIESMAQAHIALQQLCEVYRSAYEEARGIVNTPVKLPPLIPDDGYSVDAMCNWARNEARNKIALIIVSHGLTVQED